MCESDARCQAFLKKAWPGVPVWPDVRTFTLADATQGSTILSKPIKNGRAAAESSSDACGSLADAGRIGSGQDEPGREPSGRTAVGRAGPGVWLLTAGVPCQPASRAGKQRGKADDRWLWDDAIKVFAAVRPAWGLFENPPGIGDVGLAGILSDLEAQGYAVRVFSVGACALGAPHRRMRYWIVCRRLADASRSGELRTERLASEQDSDGQDDGVCHGGNAWSRYVWTPCADSKLRRSPDVPIELADGVRVELPNELGTPWATRQEDRPHKSILGAIGNSIVPQIACVIIRAMIQSETNDPS